MPKSTPTCNSIINLVYRAVTWANLAENASASPITDIYVGLHTGNLTAATDSQAENETAYTNYVRVAAARPAGWAAASGGATQNAATISFAQCGVTGATLTHVSTGKASAGATSVFHYGALNSSLAVSSGITPQFAAGALTVTEA